ncbi:MAG: hypothetical protein WA828_00765 [Coleofasciculaceae cyanobacterium]
MAQLRIVNASLLPEQFQIAIASHIALQIPHSTFYSDVSSNSDQGK